MGKINSERNVFDFSALSPNNSSQHSEKSLFAIPCALGFVVATPVSTVGLPGDFILLATSFLAAALVLSNLKRYLFHSLILSILFIIIYILGTLNGSYVSQGLRHAGSIFCGVFAFLFFATYGGSLMKQKIFIFIFCALIISSIVVVIFSGMEKNITGGTITYLLSLLIIVLFRNSLLLGSFIFSILVGLFGIVLEFRGIIGYAVTVVLVAVGFKIFSKRTMFILGIFITVFSIYLLIWFFSSSDHSVLVTALSAMLEEYSGRRVESGREWLWPSIFNAVSQSPWTGLGSGILPRDFLGTTLSSHNYYLQVLLQVGYIGLFILIAYLISIWSLLVRVSHDPAGAFPAGLLVMFCLHNGSEVIMLQNAMYAGVPAWSALGIGLSVALQRVSNK